MTVVGIRVNQSFFLYTRDHHVIGSHRLYLNLHGALDRECLYIDFQPLGWVARVKSARRATTKWKVFNLEGRRSWKDAHLSPWYRAGGFARSIVPITSGVEFELINAGFDFGCFISLLWLIVALIHDTSDSVLAQYMLPQFMVFLGYNLVTLIIVASFIVATIILMPHPWLSRFIVGFGYGFLIYIDASVCCWFWLCLPQFIISVMVAFVWLPRFVVGFSYGCLGCIDASISGCVGLLLVSVMVASVVLMPRLVVASVYCVFRLWLTQFIVGFVYGCLGCIDASISGCLSLLFVLVMVASLLPRFTVGFNYGRLNCIDASTSGCIGLLLVSIIVGSVVFMVLLGYFDTLTIVASFIIASIFLMPHPWLPQLYRCLSYVVLMPQLDVASVYCWLRLWLPRFIVGLSCGCLGCIDALVSGCLGLLLVSFMVASVWLPQLYWCLDGGCLGLVFVSVMVASVVLVPRWWLTWFIVGFNYSRLSCIDVSISVIVASIVLMPCLVVSSMYCWFQLWLTQFIVGFGHGCLSCINASFLLFQLLLTHFILE
ncbi:hypothetical protein DVH24_012148 [Malus domestica]|uniref:Uncharacterized protein n=1 Tax=Malus domestica TaxID=3750 RepID=A0A498HQ92_MALDO|nr:hypothetical protein DVH24_012148 [Malus domestica]